MAASAASKALPPSRRISIAASTVAGSPAALPPADARISLPQALAAYTANGARQLGLEEEIGAIRAGLRADFVVLPRDPFDTAVEDIHAIAPSATVMDGELRSGSL